MTVHPHHKFVKRPEEFLNIEIVGDESSVWRFGHLCSLIRRLGEYLSLYKTIKTRSFATCTLHQILLV